MNQIINELRAALSLANTVSTSTNDAYMDGVACGIAFCLEQLDGGSMGDFKIRFVKGIAG